MKFLIKGQFSVFLRRWGTHIYQGEYTRWCAQARKEKKREKRNKKKEEKEEKRWEKLEISKIFLKLLLSSCITWFLFSNLYYLIGLDSLFEAVFGAK